MNKLIVASIFCFFLHLHANAQLPGMPEPHRDNRGKVFGEQVQVERIAYFTEKIGLTTEEAQLFWPVYNEMDSKRSALFVERASVMQQYMNGAANLSDKQVDELLNRLVVIQQQEMAMPAEYDAKFRKVLPARKVMSLYVAEMGFRRYLLQKMRNRHDGRTDKP